jgi:hypothetical protein
MCQEEVVIYFKLHLKICLKVWGNRRKASVALAGLHAEHRTRYFKKMKRAF